MLTEPVSGYLNPVLLDHFNSGYFGKLLCHWVIQAASERNNTVPGQIAWLKQTWQRTNDTSAGVAGFANDLYGRSHAIENWEVIFTELWTKYADSVQDTYTMIFPSIV